MSLYTGRQLQTRSAIKPRRVMTTIQRAPRDWANSTAANDNFCLSLSVLSLSTKRKPGCFSTCSAMLTSWSIQRSGYFPTVVSPDNITASTSSKTALATSVTSARVGIGFEIIDSSKCVATITLFPCSEQDRTIFRCTVGTVWIGISIPRSPRATITPSTSAMISLTFETPS